MEGHTLTKPVSFWSSINNPAVKAEMPVATLGQAVEKIAIYLKFLGVIEVYAGMGTFLHTNQRYKRTGGPENHGYREYDQLAVNFISKAQLDLIFFHQDSINSPFFFCPF